MRGLGLGLGFGPMGAAVNPLVASYLARVAAAGGSLSSSRRAAATDLIIGWEVAGLVGKTIRLNAYATDGLAGLGVPMLNPNGEGNAADTNNGFIGADYSPTVGLTNNGSTKSFATGVEPFTSVATKNSLGLFAFANGVAPVDDYRAFLGAYGGAADAATLMVHAPGGSPHLNSRIGANGSTEIVHSVPGGLVSRLYGAHWNAGGNLVPSISGVAVGTPVAQSVITGATGGITIGARNSGGTPALFLDGTIGAYAIMGSAAGVQLTTQNLADMNTLLTAFQAAMGRP